MASEIQVPYYVRGATLYVEIRSATGQPWNTATSSFGAYSSGSFTNYDIALSEQGSSGVYAANMPSLAAGVYSIVARRRAGGSPAESDEIIAVGEIAWDGTAILDPSAASARVILAMPAVAHSSAGGLPTVGSGTGQISLDGGMVTADTVELSGEPVYTTSGVVFPANVGNSTLDAAGVRAALGLAAADLDTQLGAIPTAEETATAVRAELADELAHLDADVSSRLAGDDYTAPPDAAAIRDAVGLAAADLDTQLTGLPAAVWASAARTLTAFDFTASANVVQVAGQTAIAAGTVTFPAAIGTSTYAGADTAGTTTLLSRLTATRAGYLDHLSGGAVALAGTTPAWYSTTMDISTSSGSALVAATAAATAVAITSDHGAGSYARNTEPPSAATVAAQVRVELSAELAHLDADVSDLATQTSIEDLAEVADAIKGRTDLIPDQPAAVGSAMTLTEDERAATAAGLLDLADGVEDGVTLRQALRLMAAALAGKRSGVGTALERYDAVGSPGTARVRVNVDENGNGEPTLTP